MPLGAAAHLGTAVSIPPGARANAPFALIYLRRSGVCKHSARRCPSCASAGHASSCCTHLWPNSPKNKNKSKLLLDLSLAQTTRAAPGSQPGLRPPPPPPAPLRSPTTVSLHAFLFKLASMGMDGDEVRIKSLLLIQRLLMDPPDGHSPTPSKSRSCTYSAFWDGVIIHVHRRAPR